MVEVPLDTEENCTTSGATATGRELCFGDSGSSGFYTKDESDLGFYLMRRRVFINIYGFDRLHSHSSSTPYVHIVGCEFRYFLRHYESLIYVENNNYHIDTPVGTTTDPNNKGIYSYLGEDRGLDLTIDNSVFEYSRFCKGLIVYRTSPYVMDSDTLFNFTHEYVS